MLFVMWLLLLLLLLRNGTKWGGLIIKSLKETSSAIFVGAVYAGCIRQAHPQLDFYVLVCRISYCVECFLAYGEVNEPSKNERPEERLAFR